MLWLDLENHTPVILPNSTGTADRTGRRTGGRIGRFEKLFNKMNK
jgi:hypothetical protein